MRWIFRELGDALEFFVIPFLLALLPWWLGFRLVHWVAYLPFYNAGVARCFDNAVELGLASRAHKAEWVRACRASQLVDIVDIYLCLFRGNRFLDRYVQTNFDDKGLQQQLLVSFPHYGAGLWLYRYLHRLGLRSNLLINPLKKKPFFVRPFFRTLSYRLRVYVLTQHCGVNIISPGDMDFA